MVNGKIQFTAKQGPNPYEGYVPLHVITTKQGKIFCTWTATFTITPVGNNQIILSGPGAFTISGGTGIYANAKGSVSLEEIPGNDTIANIVINTYIPNYACSYRRWQ